MSQTIPPATAPSPDASPSPSAPVPVESALRGALDHCMEAALQGNPEPGADLNLSARNQSRLLAFIRRNMGPKLRSLYEAEDILQDVLLSAHEAPGGFSARPDEPHGGVLPWLHTIALHRIWNLSRSLRPRVRPRLNTGLPASLVQFQGEGLEEHAPPAPGQGPLQRLMAPELQMEVLKAIRELDGHRRLSLVLRGLAEASWPTITFLTGRQRESARKLHQRSTQQLRDRFLP